MLNLQQRLVDADYFELVSVQPAIDEKKDGTVPIDVLLKRDQRTVYSGEVYYSTDFGAGVRVGAERRWLNQKGHKADVKVEYSERLQEAGLHYGIPRPSRDDRSYDFGVGYRDETTDVNRSRNFQLAATRSEKRWHGFTRTMGLKYLDGDFEIGQDEDNLEYGNSKLLYRGSHAEPPPRQRPADAAQGLRARDRRAARLGGGRVGYRLRASLRPDHLADAAGRTRPLQAARRSRRHDGGRLRCVAAGAAVLCRRRSIACAASTTTRSAK